MTEQLSTEGGLSADDQAYFDTRGGEDLPDTGKLEAEAPDDGFRGRGRG
jgi:hypothetical protein